jgi:hypothetical protein
MARRRHQVLSAAVAGACVTLCACGAGSGSSATGSSAASARAATSRSAELTVRFCDNANSFMRQIPAAPPTKHLSTALARGNLRKVLQSTVEGFTRLEAVAPSSLREPLAAIVAVYKSDEKAVTAPGSLAQISESTVKGNASGSAAFQQVLRYISARCK